MAVTIENGVIRAEKDDLLFFLKYDQENDRFFTVNKDGNPSTEEERTIYNDQIVTAFSDELGDAMAQVKEALPVKLDDNRVTLKHEGETFHFLYKSGTARYAGAIGETDYGFVVYKDGESDSQAMGKEHLPAFKAAINANFDALNAAFVNIYAEAIQDADWTLNGNVDSDDLEEVRTSLDQKGPSDPAREIAQNIAAGSLFQAVEELGTESRTVNGKRTSHDVALEGNILDEEKQRFLAELKDPLENAQKMLADNGINVAANEAIVEAAPGNPENTDDGMERIIMGEKEYFAKLGDDGNVIFMDSDKTVLDENNPIRQELASFFTSEIFTQNALHVDTDADATLTEQGLLRTAELKPGDLDLSASGVFQNAAAGDTKANWYDPSAEVNADIKSIQQALGVDTEYQARMSAGLARHDDGIMGGIAHESRTLAVIEDYATKQGIDYKSMSAQDFLAHVQENLKPSVATAPDVKSAMNDAAKPSLYDGVVWADKKEQTQSRSGVRGKPGFREAEYETVAERTDGIKDANTQTGGLFDKNSNDENWAVGLGYDMKAKAFPEGTDKAVIEAAREGTYSIGKGGQVYLTRIDEEHGLQRYEVSEYLAKQSAELGHVDVLLDDKYTARLDRALDELSMFEDFKKENGILLHLDNGLQLHVHKHGDATQFSILNEQADSEVLSKARAQTPAFMQEDKDKIHWRRFNKPGELAERVAKAGGIEAAAERPEAQEITVVEAKPDVVNPAPQI